MPTFQEQFCARHHCSQDKFARKLFWLSLPPRARVFAVCFGGSQGRFFAADRSFINAIATAQNVDDVRREVHDFFTDPQNRGWLRHRAKIRISIRRLTAVAIQCLGSQDESEVITSRIDSQDPFDKP